MDKISKRSDLSTTFGNCLLRLVEKRPDDFYEYAMKNPDFVLRISNADVLCTIFKDFEADKLLELLKLTNGRRENFFHRLAASTKLTMALDAALGRRELGLDILGELLLARDNAGNSPLMVAAQNLMELNLWEVCHDCFSQNFLSSSLLDLKQGNKKNHNLLHIVADAGNPDLFVAICKSEHISREDKLAAINSSSDVGSPLKYISREACLMHLLKEHFPMNDLNDDTRSQVFLSACKNNYFQVILHFRENLRSEQLMDIIGIREGHQNALMTAARHCSDIVLMSSVTAIYYTLTDQEQKREFLHVKNEGGETLLNIVMMQGDQLATIRDCLIKMERDFHREEEQGFKQLVTCLKENVGPNEFVHKAIETEKDYKSITWTTCLIMWFYAFLGFIIPLTLFAFDIFSDAKLVVMYYNQKQDEPQSCNEMCGSYKNATDELLKIPMKLSTDTRAIYTMGFMVAPILCYLFEWYENGCSSLTKLVNDMLQKGFRNKLLLPYIALRIVFEFFYHLLLIFLWPVYGMASTFIAKCKYVTEVGAQKANRHQQLEELQFVGLRAHMIEVSIESSFQPLLQMYLLLPCLYYQLTCPKKDFLHWDTADLQKFSVLTSVASLAWSFTRHEHIKLKGGMTIAAFCMLLLGNILQVIPQQGFKCQVFQMITI